MNLLSLHLQACSPERNIFRSYSIWLGQDLFDDWMVSVTYGRIRAKGTTRSYVFSSQEDALKKLTAILRKRSSAYKRLGCSYRLVDFHWNDYLNKLDLQSSFFCSDGSSIFGRIEPFPLLHSTELSVTCL